MTVRTTAPASTELHADRALIAVYLADMARAWEDEVMAPPSVSLLLKLPAAERAALAMALWDSLTDRERDAALDLTPEQEMELDRRWEAYLEDPASAKPWSEVRRQLLDDR